MSVSPASQVVVFAMNKRASLGPARPNKALQGIPDRVGIAELGVVRRLCTRPVRTIILIFTFLALSFMASADEPTVNRLLRSVRAELPKGWTASHDNERAWLEVSRVEAVLAISTLPNEPGGEKPERRTFAFAFRVVAAVHPTEYRRLSAENAQVQKKATALYEDLIRKRVSHKFDSFSPSTDEEKAAVAQYEALKKSLHPLPDFYFEAISLKWKFNSPDNPMIRVTDDSVRDECTRVQEKVVKLLSKYEGA
jgi:hypothetical protein